MFLFKSGEVVEKGIYWEPNTNKKIVIEDKGYLPGKPGNKREWYFKLPESYLLIPIFLVALALSMAFPYGVGIVIFGILYGMFRVLYFLSYRCEKMVGNLFAHVWFRYKPNLSFFSGNKKKRKPRTRYPR